MALYWLCECGAKFEEKGREEPGNDSGYNEAVIHAQRHKNAGEPEELEGLYDSDKGEIIFKGIRGKAVQLGILPRKGEGSKSSATAGSNKLSSSLYPIRIVTKDISLPPGVMVLFYEDQKIWPTDYPDDSPETISRWLTDCVVTFHREHPEIFTMGRILNDLVIKQYQEQVEEEEVGLNAS